MAEFKDLWISFALVGLVLFGIISFIVSFQMENGQTNGILNNTIISNAYTNLSTSLDSYNSTLEGQKTSFFSDIPLVGIGVLIFNTIISAGKIFGGMIITMFSIIIVLPLSVLGIPPIVGGVIGAILIITIILKLWSTYKVGQ